MKEIEGSFFHGPSPTYKTEKDGQLPPMDFIVVVVRNGRVGVRALEVLSVEQSVLGRANHSRTGRGTTSDLGGDQLIRMSMVTRIRKSGSGAPILERLTEIEEVTDCQPQFL